MELFKNGTELFGNGTKLNQDLMVRILSKLPATDLIQTKDVSDNWGLSLLDPHFVKCQMKNAMSSGESLGFCFGRDPDYYGLEWRFSIKPRRLMQPIRLPDNLINNSDVSFDFIGATNGLLCVKYGDDNFLRFIVFNPCTSQLTDFPYNDFKYERGESSYCFEYDPICDDYMVIVLYDQPLLDSVGVCMYSLRKKSWNYLTSISFRWNFFASTHVYIEGILYIGKSYEDSEYGSTDSIIAFKLSDYSWKEIIIPDHITSQDNMLVCYKGCLSVVKYPSNGHSITLYKCSGFPKDLTQWHCIAPVIDVPWDTIFVGMHGDEFMFERRNCCDRLFNLEILSYNIFTGEEKVLIDEDSPHESRVIPNSNFTPTLVKPF